MNIDILLDKVEGQRAWLESPATKRFFEWLLIERESVIARLRKAEGLQLVGNAQGDLERIDKILSLRGLLKDRGSKTDGGK